jgi:hypothetical protein
MKRSLPSDLSYDDLVRYQGARDVGELDGAARS